MELNSAVNITLTAVLATLLLFLLYNVWSIFVLGMLWMPLRMRRAFQAQGIPTLPFHLLYGNLPEIKALMAAASSRPMPHISHDIVPRLFPHLYHWANKYGNPFVFWSGSEAHYNVINAEDAKEVVSTKFGHYQKPRRRDAVFKSLIGVNSLVGLQAGEKWAQHRRILNPAFFADRLKDMVPTMESCTAAMMENWAPSVGTAEAVDVHQSLQDLTADVIAHTAFGSSFAEGRQVFELQREQQFLANSRINSPLIPGLRFFPTALNRRAWKIDRDIRRGLRKVICNREESITRTPDHGTSAYGNDLLGIMMAANRRELGNNQKNLTMSIEEIIDECKTFFFAGHETTATLLTWAFFCLAINPEWQDRTREEVIAVCGTKDPIMALSVNHLKIMGMVLNETLRLYPPAIVLLREASTDVQLGKVVIPRGTVLTLPIVSWHHDERYWGADANEFRPERFSEGVVTASRVAGAFMPFLMGPRVCIGQHFALLEAKVVLSTVLRHYRLRLSPSYKHAPTRVLTLQPQFGMPILLEKL